MGQNQRDGGWQRSREGTDYARISDSRISAVSRREESRGIRGEKHRDAVLRAVDSHSKKGSYAKAENDAVSQEEMPQKTLYPLAGSEPRLRLQKSRRRGRRARRIRLNKTAFPRTSKGIALFKTEQETGDEGRKGTKLKKLGIRTATAAVLLLSLFFLGKGIGRVAYGTVPTSADLLAQTDNWGLGFGAEGTQPTGNVSAAELAGYDAWYVGDAGEKVIYLTFDAGYENGNTEPILDALKKHNAPATFFVVGHYLETAPELIKRMVTEGHTVGNHTWHHPDMSSISSKESFREEMTMVETKYKELTGQDMIKFYRPPQGKYNLENLKMAQDLGYQTFFWSLAYVDWYQNKQPSHEEAFEKLTKRIHSGAIVLLHSTSVTNGEILDELLTKWEEMGYTFQPLSRLTEKKATAGKGILQ